MPETCGSVNRPASGNMTPTSLHVSYGQTTICDPYDRATKLCKGSSGSFDHTLFGGLYQLFMSAMNHVLNKGPDAKRGKGSRRCFR